MSLNTFFFSLVMTFHLPSQGDFFLFIVTFTMYPNQFWCHRVFWWAWTQY